LAAAGALDAESYERETGVAPLGGERRMPMCERMCFRPTLEVNGIHSGYGGDGSKTVIPNSAFAKISLRLVPNQSPAQVFEAVKAHIESHCPPGMKASVGEVHIGTPGFRLSLGSPLFMIAKEELDRLDERGSVFVWDGASIPVIGELHRVSGGAPLLVGFGSERDRIHAPNESYGLEQFERTMTWAEMILKALA
jgi:acetylornithine deacetylase/succinyl-diaminopimelate desuccinylase-like protein